MRHAITYEVCLLFQYHVPTFADILLNCHQKYMITLGRSKTVGSGAKVRLAIYNVLWAYTAAPGVDFADIKFTAVKFSWDPNHKRPTANFCWVHDPKPPTESVPMVRDLVSS